MIQGTNAGGIYRYLGVPYAEAKERFVPAEDVTPWEGIRMADTYGPISPQGAISGLGSAGGQEGTDNNSQNLNIWTPGVNDGKKRPVMVWLHGGGYAMDWEPVVDGDFLPTNPVTEESFAEAGLDIPLLIGSNLNEWSGFFETNPIEPTKELTAALREAYPNKEELTAEQVDTTTIRLPLLKIMTHKADQEGTPVYAYLFTYGNSYHGAEIPYVFNHTDGNEEEQSLAEQVSQSWINFARTGTPGAEGMPEWEPYTREGGATMLLDTEPELVYHHDQELLFILVPDYEY